MIFALEVLLGGLSLLLCVPVGVVFVEVAAATLLRKPSNTSAGNRARLAVVVPAHDEATAIGGTLQVILPQLRPGDRLIVVADNCSDGTAAIAATMGAEAIVRSDPVHRGKGYALDFGIRHLQSDPPELVIIIDADCQTAADAIDHLATACMTSGRPVQALYLMKAPAGTGLNLQVAEFAWIVKNQVRPTGLHRLGLPCQLMGTGMAFPWFAISNADLASGHIVEDMKLGVDLAVAGVPPLFCPEALVTSNFPMTDEGVQGQRTRWEHGHLGVITKDVPRLLARAAVSANLRLLVLALDLSVPPLALLCGLVAAAWVAGVVLYFSAGLLIPLAIMTAAAIILFAAVTLSWIQYGRAAIRLPVLLFALVYALRKIPIYAKFLVSRQANWVRTKRDGDGPPRG